MLLKAGGHSKQPPPPRQTVFPLKPLPSSSPIAGLSQVSSSVIAPTTLHDIPPRIARAMEDEETWDFNIFELEAATQNRCVRGQLGA